MIRILLADDHNILRQGIAQILEAQPDFEVVAQAKNGKEAVLLARQHKPDVALLDINMPVMDGVEATRLISADVETTRIIILTMYRLDSFIFEAIKAGASGYLLKEVEMDTLIAAVRTVADGGAVLDTTLAGRVLDEIRGKEKTKPSDTPELAERDLEILGFVAQGLSNQEIAVRLGISEKTVRNRLSGVFRQIHVQNRTEAALFALRKGLADLDGE